MPGWVGSDPPLLHELHDGRPLVGVAALLVAHLGPEISPQLPFAECLKYFGKIEGQTFTKE